MKEEIKVAIRFAQHGIKGYNESAIAQGETNDCFVRTVAAAVEVDYDTALEAEIAGEFTEVLARMHHIRNVVQKQRLKRMLKQNIATSCCI